ncbi:MAG: Xaa-Pro peptidase family protein [Muribaculaceae bacterium]|nr:Xaa-Pro peptidase family protein [Muribaculaceae bacterium]
MVLLTDSEQVRRLSRIRAALGRQAEAMLVSDNANVYYLCGRVFAGYVYVPADPALKPLYFVRRPNHLAGEQVVMIRKPEEIPAKLHERGLDVPSSLALELGALSYSAAQRLMKVFTGSQFTDATPVLRHARSVKTEFEIEKLKASGRKQTMIYNRIPKLYREGMTDVELQIEIERALRLEGCLGQFRVSGDDMELFMGNVLTGDNADNPSPYDFAMGGAGLDPSIPVGANGTMIQPGKPVMVDVNGNFTGYMTDMTRCYCAGRPDDKAVRANECSRRICAELADMGRPGAEAKSLYERARAIAAEEGLEANFMGFHSHAGFVGHGVGIEVNELPVIAPRSRDLLEAGNVIALEPKFVLPGIGAVGIENTYVVRPDGPMECITGAREEITDLV